MPEACRILPCHTNGSHKNTTALANLGHKIRPKAERGALSQVKDRVRLRRVVSVAVVPELAKKSLVRVLESLPVVVAPVGIIHY